MDQPGTQFVVTPWRTSKELLQLRHDLYGSDALKKERAVSKVFAWRLRKPEGLPLLLDSTADIVDVLLQDAKSELKHNTLRLLYATAISRFITGLADTQIDLIRDKPRWFSPGKSLQLPHPLLEIRHRIVHRHLPSLAELKRAAQDSLDWLWEWYWAQLDHAFGLSQPNQSEDGEEGKEFEDTDVVREKVQGILKGYVKERKNEIKARRKDTQAARNALSTFTLRFSPTSTSIPPHRTSNILLDLLVADKIILPADKKFGSSMTGAFLIWNPVLLAFCNSRMLSVERILEKLMEAMNSSASAMGSSDMDPVKEGWYEWITHILLSDAWNAHVDEDKLVKQALTKCFSEPGYWNLRVAERIMEEDGEVRDRDAWGAVLRAARGEGVYDGVVGGKMDVDEEAEGKAGGVSGGEVVMQVQDTKAKEKIRGPVKVVGMWKARPIGWIEGEWEDDE